MRVAPGALDRFGVMNSKDVLAQTGNSTPVAGLTICRQRQPWRNPREEPDALAGTSGSARGALGNQRPYRDPPFDAKAGGFKSRIEISYLGRMLLREAGIDLPF